MLSLQTDYEPMEATLTEVIPRDPGWQYEPKWDGFRCIAFRDGDTVELQSKSGRPLTRYFPELQETLLKLTASQFVVDGEIVVPVGDGFSFDDLLQRIHPAESRIKKLSRQFPAVFILFDILVDEVGKRLTEEVLLHRRKHLESFAAKHLQDNKQIFLSPATTNADVTDAWLESMGNRLDGLMAKRTDMTYQSGNRKGMLKVKKMRTADCVIGGFRYAAGEQRALGSLLLGLYDEKGLLNHVGFSSAFNRKEKKELLAKVEPLIAAPGFTGNAPGGPSRWSTERSVEWEPLAPILVVEIKYDHFTNGRFRHGTQLLRWRSDKRADQCTYDQLPAHQTST